MPSGSRIVLRAAAVADIPTPDADQSALFMNADEALNPPYWIDEFGDEHPLTGEDGALTYLDHGNTGATETVDVQVATIQRLVANAATVTLTLSNPPGSGTPGIVRLWLEQDGVGGRDWAFPGSVEWGDAGEPVWTGRSAGHVDLVDLTTVDGGTTYLATVAGREGPPGGSDLDVIIAASSGQDIADALAGAAAPDSGNVFATMADVGGGGALAAGRAARTAGNLTTSSTTFVDATSMSVTITTGAHYVAIGWNAIGEADSSSVPNDHCVDIDVDGTRIGGTHGLAEIQGYANNRRYNLSGTTVTNAALTAGSHTFKLQWRVTGGTGTLYASSTAPLTMWVQELNV